LSKKDEVFVHDSAFVDEGAEIGKGTKVWHFTHIREGTKIGEGCNIGQNVYIGRGVKIGKGVKIQNNVSVYEGVEVGDYVFFGPSAVLTNVFNPRSEFPRKDEFKKTIIRDGATVGANATVVCGVTLGRSCFIGAGAVVTKDVGDFSLVYGTPARHMGWICACGVNIEFGGEGETACPACGREYVKKEECVSLVSTGEGKSG
jgi:UDP-2-acetamido-3-amino-2,3-dideoxy-glucuronate N-acetyltransferase